MILRRLFSPVNLVIALSAMTCFFGTQKATAQDDGSGISVSRLNFGAQTNDKWLKVDLKNTGRSGLTNRPVSTGVPTVGLGNTTRTSTTYASPRVVSSTPGPLIYPAAKTRVRNIRLLQAAGIAVGSAHAHSTGSCWRYVKSALLKAEVIDSYPKTGYAKQAASELVEDYGFVRTKISNPFSAPVGSVLVYGGSGAGHIEIRTLTGFVSDFVSAKPSNRPLIGVFVK